MPIDFESKKIYNVDFDELYKEINGAVLLDDKDIQKEYLLNWMNVLKEANEKLESDFDYYIEENQRDRLKYPERYCFRKPFNSCEICIDLRISKLIEVINQRTKKEDICSIPIEEFTHEFPLICWDDVLDDAPDKANPIILIPFRTGATYTLLTVDGNHRIKKAIKSRKKAIDAYIINEEILIDNNIFATEFEMLVYIFNNEIVTIGTHTLRDGFCASDLMKKSFLKTGKILKYSIF